MYFNPNTSDILHFITLALKYLGTHFPTLAAMSQNVRYYFCHISQGSQSSQNIVLYSLKRFHSTINPFPLSQHSSLILNKLPTF